MLAPSITADLIEMAAMLAALFISALVWRKSVRRGWLLASAGAIIIGVVTWSGVFGLLESPPLFDGLRYPWFDNLLLLVVSLAVILAIPNGLQRAGLTFRQDGPGLIPAMIVAVGLVALLTWTAVTNVFGDPAFSVEPLAFNWLASIPAEQVFFRGLILALVLEAFGARRTVLAAELNWGIIPAGLVFGLAHLTSVSGGEIVFNTFQTLWTCFGGLLLGWLRQATGSLLLPYGVHAYGNGIHYFI